MLSIERQQCRLLAQSRHEACDSDVRFSNRPFEVKHFQTIRHCSVDVAHGLVLLFGIGTKGPCMGLLLSRSSAVQRMSSFVSFFVRSESPVSSSRPAAGPGPSRAGAVKVGRRTNLSICFALARPYLDSFEHDGTPGAVGMTIRGEPAFGRGSIAPQPCIR